MEHTLGLFERTRLLVMLSDGSKVFFNNGASSSSSDLLIIPLHFFGELSAKRIKQNNNLKIMLLFLRILT